MTERVSAAVQRTRRDEGLTQQELAERAGVSRATIARIERGQDVSMLTLQKVAVALGLALKLERS